MRKRKALFLLLIFFNPFCFGKLKVTSTGEVFHAVPLIQESQTEIGGDEISLIPFGRALASRVFDICVVQLLVSDPDQFKEGNHWDLQEAIAIRMTFLIPLKGNGIYSVMRKALEENGVDIHREDIKDYLEAIKASVEEGDSFVFLGKRLPDGGELVEVKIPHSRRLFRMSGEGVIRDVFSAWLENVSYEDYLKRVKQQLLGKSQPFSSVPQTSKNWERHN